MFLEGDAVNIYLLKIMLDFFASCYATGYCNYKL